MVLGVFAALFGGQPALRVCIGFATRPMHTRSPRFSQLSGEFVKADIGVLQPSISQRLTGGVVRKDEFLSHPIKSLTRCSLQSLCIVHAVSLRLLLIVST